MSSNFGFNAKYPSIKTLFIGGVGDEVTGSCTLLKILTSDGNVRYGIVDCGAVQGANEELNYEYPVKGNDISFVLLTHGHFDHIGSLPILYRQGFKGKIYCTSVVKSIAGPMLRDAAKINMHRAGRDFITAKSLRKVSNSMMYECHTDMFYKDRKNIDSAMAQIDELNDQVLYSEEDVEETLKLFESVQPNEFVEVEKNTYAKFIPTPHQNGASKIELMVDDTDTFISLDMLFSGDIGPSNSILYKNRFEKPNYSVDCILLESLHGVETPPETPNQSVEKLRSIILDATKRRKSVVLAGFSLDRNAILVYLLNQFRKEGIDIDVIIDSPLTMAQLAVYKNTYDQFDSFWFKNLDEKPFDTNHFKVIDFNRESVASALHGEGPRVIITASANGNGGRIVNYFKNCIQRSDYVFVICGWVAPDSPSRILHEARRGEIVEISPDEHYVKKCETVWMQGFTSHGYFPEMMSIINTCPNAHTVILNHASIEAKFDIAERVLMTHNVNVAIPDSYEAYELTKNGVRLLSLDECTCAFNEVLTRNLYADFSDNAVSEKNDDKLSDEIVKKKE